MWGVKLKASPGAEWCWSPLKQLFSVWAGCSAVTCAAKELVTLCWHVYECMRQSGMTQAPTHNVHFNACFLVSRNLCHCHFEVLLWRVSLKHHLHFSLPDFFSLEKSYGLLSPSISKNHQVVIICFSLCSKDVVTGHFYTVIRFAAPLCGLWSLWGCQVRGMTGWLCSALDDGKLITSYFVNYLPSD